MEPYRRSLWLIDLLSRESLTRDEIADRWEHSSINDDGECYSRRTFIRDKEYILDTFQLEIAYNRDSKTYSLSNPDFIKRRSLIQYSIEQNRLFGLAKLSSKLKEKIYVEPIQSGSDHLQTLLTNIEQGVIVQFDYVSY